MSKSISNITKVLNNGHKFQESDSWYSNGYYGIRKQNAKLSKALPIPAFNTNMESYFDSIAECPDDLTSIEVRDCIYDESRNMSCHVYAPIGVTYFNSAGVSIVDDKDANYFLFLSHYVKRLHFPSVMSAVVNTKDTSHTQQSPVYILSRGVIIMPVKMSISRVNELMGLITKKSN